MKIGLVVSPVALALLLTGCSLLNDDKEKREQTSSTPDVVYALSWALIGQKAGCQLTASFPDGRKVTAESLGNFPSEYSTSTCLSYRAIASGADGNPLSAYPPVTNRRCIDGSDPVIVKGSIPLPKLPSNVQASKTCNESRQPGS